MIEFTLFGEKMKLRKNRKGISTFIATLILMVLAVAAGVVIYAYVMGYLGGFSTPQTMGALSLDNANLDATAGLNAYVRNIGHTSFTIDTIYISSGTATGKAGGYDTNKFPATLTEGQVGNLVISAANWPASPALTSGVTYTIKLIGKDNTQITFNVKS